MALWTPSNSSTSLLWGPQTWTEHSKRGLTRAEQKVRISSLDLLITNLLAQPRIWIWFWATRVRCQVMLNFSPTNTPKSFPPSSCQPTLCPACIAFGVALTRVQHLYWTSQVSHRPTSQVFQDPSEWHHFPPVYQKCTRLYCRWTDIFWNFCSEIPPFLGVSNKSLFF